jgi:hypothetical protein
MEIIIKNPFQIEIKSSDLEQLAKDTEQLFSMENEKVDSISITILSNKLLIKTYSKSSESEIMAISDLQSFRFELENVLKEKGNVLSIQRKCTYLF